MKKYIILAALICCGTASFGLVAPPAEPPSEISSNSDSDPTGAIFLLALVAVVVASSTVTSRAKAQKDPYLLPEDADN